MCGMYRFTVVGKNRGITYSQLQSQAVLLLSLLLQRCHSWGYRETYTHSSAVKVRRKASRYRDTALSRFFEHHPPRR